MTPIVLSDEADADLEAIGAYSLATFGAATSESYLQSFRQAFQLLSEHPRIGTWHDEIDPPIHSLPNRSHRIYYDIEEHRVIIQRILHKAMNIEQELR